MASDPTPGVPDLTGAVIRLCPACGVVNPAGPVAGCAHVQLIRFDGVPAELATLLARVAEARREYNDLSAALREQALAAVHQGRARVETLEERSARPAEGRRGPGGPADERLELISPTPAARKNAAASPRPRRRSPPAVDPRQLDLIARGPAKGEA